jgi:hypothetical protein
MPLSGSLGPSPPPQLVRAHRGSWAQEDRPAALAVAGDGFTRFPNEGDRDWFTGHRRAARVVFPCISNLTTGVNSYPY